MQVFFCDRIYFELPFFIQYLKQVQQQFFKDFFVPKKQKKTCKYNIGLAAMLADGSSINIFFFTVHLPGLDKHRQTFVC
jgi:hypothetical protein